jgi:hypothetical protein
LREVHRLPLATVSYVAILYNVAAVVGPAVSVTSRNDMGGGWQFCVH